MSEGSSQLFTQPFFSSDTSTDSDGQTIVGCGLTQAKKDAVNKPRFVDFACSHSEVGVRCLETFKVLIIHNRSIDMLYWSRKRSFQRHSGEGRRISRLSGVVRDAVLGCQHLSYPWGIQTSGSSSSCEDSKSYRCITFYKTSKSRSANGWDPLAPMASPRST